MAYSKEFQFYIVLTGTNPAVWRKLAVPGEYSFYQFHMAIQAAFGWENVHLFEFRQTPIQKNHAVIGIPYEDSETEIVDARELTVNQIFRKKNDECVYLYDFGDYWEHSIVVEKVLNKDLNQAFCLDGANECPPEDVGGIGGYSQMLACLATGTKKDKKQYLDWLQLTDWDASHFNKREVNKRLALVKPDY